MMKKMAFVPSGQQQAMMSNQSTIQTMTPQQMEITEKLPKKKNTYLPLTDKVNRIVKIVLKLAKIGGYDGEARIVSKNGYTIEKSNLISLLNHCMTIGHPLYGEQEFIELLKLAKVDPELIINENVKSKLSQIYEPPNVVNTVTPTVITNEDVEEPRTQKRPRSPDESVIEDWELPSKRFHEDVDSE